MTAAAGVPPSGPDLDRSVVQAVAWNAVAKWTAQIVSWVSTIIVARLLTPYDYGLVGMAGVYLAFVTVISQSGIGTAVITLRDLTGRQIEELNTVAVLLGLGLVALSWAVALPLAHFFSAPPLRAVVMAVSIAYIFLAIEMVPRALLQRDLRFKTLTFIETARNLSQVAITIGLAWLGFRYWSLVVGQILGCAVSAILSLCFKRQRYAVPHLKNLRRELRFSGHILAWVTGSYIQQNSDFLVAGRVLGEVPLGSYSVAWTISSAPVEKITNLVSTVTPAYFSALQTNKSELRRYFLRLTEVMSYVTVPASMGLALVADYLVPVLLGPKWLGVIGPLRFLGLFFAVRSVTTLLPQLLNAIGDTRFVMWTTLASAAVMPVAFFVGSHWNTEGIALAWVLVYPLVMCPMYWRVFHRIEAEVRDYIYSVVPALGASVIMSCVVLATRLLVTPRLSLPLRLATLIGVGVLSYGGALFALYGERVTRLLRTVRGMQRQPASTEKAAAPSLPTQ